ncbi:MAG: 1-phosphofructokinase [Lachnospiraceae bacterium]|nr:1-phosphofructokinase [Lachnospiraceae bacterium]MBQ9607670.1 1-phosphofructokinase [Lachnospiraceae bacterium]
MVYTVTFNPALDYVVHLEEPIVNGQMNRSTREEFYYGGKGINVSTVLTNLGADTVAMGFVAGFTGAAIVHGLTHKGIRTDFIILRQGISRVNVKIRNGVETDINAAGPRLSNDDVKAFMKKLDDLTEGDYLVLSGSIPPNMHDVIYERICRRVADKNVQVVVDADGDLLMNTLQMHPFLIKPNKAELGSLFKAKIKNDKDIEKYARKLQEMGARNVLISMGGEGSMFIPEGDGKVIRMGVPEGKVINTVGAGDSMVAGFLAGYMKNGDFQKAMNLATAAGSATAFSEGLGEKSTIMMQLEKINNNLWAK